MTGVTVIVAICAVGLVFVIYVFAALCKENRRGACQVVQRLRKADDEVEIPLWADRKIIPIDVRSRGHRRFGASKRTA